MVLTIIINSINPKKNFMDAKRFNIEVFPAYRGDCFLISCHNGNKSTNILIDAGFSNTFKELKRRLENIRPEVVPIVKTISGDF